ncbi:hypothetical protein, partial [Endozoicomonas sp. SESOKO1]|uniref:hypothetical protein n=1 Tax=Endozoicomonas sp. SESOKO1 TaxID=2828742 RepID=UPI0021491C1E
LTDQTRDTLSGSLIRAIERSDYDTAKRLQGAIEGAGSTLTDQARDTLSGYLIRAIEYSDYDTAERLQGTIEGTGSTLTDEARSTLVRKLKWAKDHGYDSTVARLQRMILDRVTRETQGCQKYGGILDNATNGLLQMLFGNA